MNSNTSKSVSLSLCSAMNPLSVPSAKLLYIKCRQPCTQIVAFHSLNTVYLITIA